MDVHFHRASASKERWESLTGTFTLEAIPKRVVFFLEGPDPGVDLLIDSVVVSSYIVSKCEVRGFFLSCCIDFNLEL